MELKSNNWYMCTKSFEFFSNTFTKGKVYYCYKDNLVSDQGSDISIYALIATLVDEPFELISNPVDTFKSITDKMVSTYETKNHDYGSSFNKSLDKFGLVAAAVRMGDKMNRIETLIDKDPKVTGESIKDTLLDLANYAVMTLIWLKSKE